MSKPKSKLLFIVQLPPPVHGVSMMNKITVESTLINQEFDCLTLPLIFNKNLKNIGKVSFGKIFKFIHFYLKLVKALIYFKPNLVYFTMTPTGPSFYRDALIVWITKCFKPQLILHLHGKGINNKIKSSKFHRAFYNKIFHNTHVIHLSKSLKKDLENVSTSYFSYVLPNGIKEGSFKDQNSNPDKKAPSILFLSNLAENKGVYTLLDAAKILKNKSIPFYLNFVGKETKVISANDFNSKVKQLGLEGRVKYLGPKYDEEKNCVLSEADIFAFPTYNDCFPLVILEAMQAGLPIISTYEGAISDIIEDGRTGYIIDYKDPITLANKLQYLIDNPEKREFFGKNAVDRFQKNFTLSQYENNLHKILLRIDGYN